MSANRLANARRTVFLEMPSVYRVRIAAMTKEPPEESSRSKCLLFYRVPGFLLRIVMQLVALQGFTLNHHYRTVPFINVNRHVGGAHGA